MNLRCGREKSKMLSRLFASRLVFMLIQALEMLGAVCSLHLCESEFISIRTQRTQHIATALAPQESQF